MAKSQLPSVDLLRNLLCYDPEDGVIRWRPRGPEMFPEGKISADGRSRCWNGNHAGKEAGSINSQGYRMIETFGRCIGAHRVAWALHYGNYPSGQIDHKNGDRSDNRICNLRDVSAAENAKNRKIRSDSRTGMAGVEKLPSREKCWRAFLCINGKRTHLGVYHTADEALSARRVAMLINGYHENHGRGGR